MTKEIINFRGVEQEVHFIKEGVGNNISGGIYLHEGLKEPAYADLYEWIVNHEKGHNMYLGKPLRDAAHDAWMPLKYYVKYYKFIFTHRGAWKQLLFLRWMKLPGQKETTMLFDVNRFIFTLICAGLVWGIFQLPVWLA